MLQKEEFQNTDFKPLHSQQYEYFEILEVEVEVDLLDQVPVERVEVEVDEQMLDMFDCMVPQFQLDLVIYQ